MKTNQLLKSSLALVTIGILGTVTAFTVRQGEIAKTAHLRDPKPSADVLQFTSGGHVLGFAKSGVYVANGSHALRVEFVNAHSTTPLSTTSPSETGNTKAAPPLSQVTYPNLWDGVTLTYDAPSGAVARSTYRLDPHAKIDNIRLRYNAPVAVRGDGSLRVNFKTGTLNESAPQAWQERGGKRVPVQIAFAPSGKDEITFTTGHYDQSQPLFIDPTLTWNSFLGGSGFDHCGALALDGSGNVYVVGYSYATWGSPVRAFNEGDVEGFAAKLDSSGNLIWNTFLGGSLDDGCFGVAVDGSGNVYVAGHSHTSWGSPVRAFSGDYDAVAVKLDSNGNLIWNTFLGGTGHDEGYTIAVDGSGNVYMAGTCLATWGSPVRPFIGGGHDAFAAKLDSSGNLIWNTFLGGSSEDFSYGLAVDGSGNVYVSGFSSATWGSPVRAFSGDYDGFVAKLDSSGNLTWNTFLGGGGADYQVGLALDGSGNVCVAGYSSASWGSPVRAFSGGAYDGFAAKLDSSGNLTWNTFLGGSGDDYGSGLAVDGSGNVYVEGFSTATWGSPDRAFSGGTYDAYAVKLDSSGNLTWNAFLGGSGADVANGTTPIAVDMSGNVYVAGDSDAPWGSPVRAFSGGGDVFVAKLSAASPCQFSTAIASNFNGTPISGGNYIWFNGVLKPSGLGATPVTIRFTQQTITSANFTLSVPDASVTFDPAATTATTTFSGGMWVTRVPSSGLAGNTFFSALGYLVPANLPGGIRNVTWSGIISSDTPGVSVQWKWAAAVYTSFSSDYNALGVKQVDDNRASQYHNSDHAGTPENFKSHVTGGAAGGGGSNYTGGYSGTAAVRPCP